MEEVIKLLTENNIGALATVENGKPRVRPFQFQFYENGMFYFCTANSKDVFNQLQKNPYIEFSTTSKEMVTLRLSGKIEFRSDISLKEKIIENNVLVKSIYKTADNPIFEVFCLEHGKAIVFDFSGQPPKEKFF